MEQIMLTDSDFRKILEHYDLPWRGFRKVRKGVMKRVRRHMNSLHCSSISDYIRLLDQDRDEAETLHSLLKVTISRFYRDRYLWDHLAAHIIPGLLRKTEKITI